MCENKKKWSSSRWEYWLTFVIVISILYTAFFTLSSLLSNDSSISEECRSFWENKLFITNGVFCFIAVLHLFIFDRQERSVINPGLSKATSLMLSICPLFCASFDPFKKAFINLNAQNHPLYSAIGAILIICILYLINSAINNRKKKPESDNT